MTRTRYWLALALAMTAMNAMADDTQRQMGDDYGDAYVHYMPYVAPIKPAKQPVPKPDQSRTTTPAEPVQSRPEAVTVDWLRKNYPLLEQRAIDNPTQTNVEAYLYAKRIILDKAQRFEEMDMKVINSDPLLNENNRIPLASMGAQSIAKANLDAEDQAVREMAKTGGLMVFVDGNCRFCSQQLPIIDRLDKQYGMQALIISIDGRTPKGYNGKVVRDNGMFRKLHLQLTPSIVYVPHPKAYRGSDPNRYLVISQGFYAQDQLVKQIAYAGFETNLLTADVSQDLSVWDKGVAATTDLNQLKLDPNHPEQFRGSIDPILAKQYRGE